MKFSLPVLCLLASCGDGFSDPSREFGPRVEGEPTYPVVIEVPRTLGVVDTPVQDVNGTPVGVACDTCHGPSPTESWANKPGEPFHTAVGTTDAEGVRRLDKHGELKCDACHAEDRLGLHLADGTSFGFWDTIALCGQCHGPQYRDYKHGSHGGMNGYWDLRQGPRSRNHCTVCHAQHSPHYEKRMPVHRPKDRYLEPEAHDGD